MKYVPKPDLTNFNISSEHPLREAFLKSILFIVLAGLLALAFLLIGNTLARKIPYSWEKKIFAGHLSETVRAGAPSLVRPQEILNQLSALEPAFEGNRFRLTLDCSVTPNAFAVPGGTVILTQGLLKSGVETEKGLAFVLGHELGHFAHRDHLQAFGRGLGLELFRLLFRMEQLGDLQNGVSDLVGLSFDREAESRADRYGLELLDKLYLGDVAGAEELFVRLGKTSNTLSSKIPSFLSTHPSSPDRADRIRLLERTVAAGFSGLPNNPRLELVPSVCK